MQGLHRLSICSALFALFFIPLNAEAQKISSKEALACTDSSKCAYFFDLYAADKPLRQQLDKIFKTAGIKMPRWVGKGVSSPVTPLLIAKQPYLLSSVCEPHNCGHSVSMLYSPAQKRIVARYKTDDASARWLGAPNSTEQQLISEYETADSPLQKILDSQTKRPIVID